MQHWLFLLSLSLALSGCGIFSEEPDEPSEPPPESQLEITPGDILEEKEAEPGAEPPDRATRRRAMDEENTNANGEPGDGADEREARIEKPGRLTPLDQSAQATDLEITRDIRVRVVRDESLSFDAHNIKIITIDGVVTLRGLVHGQDERERIVAIAQDVAGANQVREHLTVMGR